MAVIEKQPLNEMQLHLLRFFSERKPTTEETADIQRLIANYYAQKADEVMEKLWKEKQFDEQKIFEILNKDLK